MARPIRRRLLVTGGLAAALCLAALFAASGAWAAAGWSPQSSGTSSALGAVAFPDASHGVAVGAGGALVVSSDGGATWAAAGSATPQALNGVAFGDATDGWAVGAAGTILHTTDGGATWASQSSPTSHDLRAVAFADAHDGWAVGAAGAIVHTTDAGLTWVTQASSAPAAPDLNGVAAAAGGLRGSAVGAGGVVLRTLDGGVADAAFPVTTAAGLQATRHAGWRNKAQTVSLAASDRGSGVAAVYYTVDGGSRKTYKGAFAVSGAGSHLVSYWAVDLVGNAETAHSGYVNIDTAAPVCVALANVTAAHGKLATFSYRIKDAAPSCGVAAVKITIYRGHKLVKTMRVTGVAENAKRTCTYRVRLANGSYTWVVTATDAAGNAQRTAGRRGLSVVTWVIHTTADVQRCLIALRYLPAGAVSGTDDYRTQQALMAYQAWNGLVRDGRDGPKTRARLQVGTSPKPRRESASGHYAEVFRSLGVLLCVNNGKLVRVVHCSTGRPSLPTPAGHFSVYMKAIAWWTTEYLDWMPYASFFNAGDAIHGFPDVPAYPASHGCVRISMPEAPWVYSFMNYGAAVIVY